MERKIGEVFEYNGEWCQCVKDKLQESCVNCCFYNGGYKKCDNETVGNCLANSRSDGYSVCFKKLEKVGEPIEYNGSFHQGYKAIDTAIDVCKFCVFSEISCGDAVICDKGVFYIKIKQSQENMEEKKLNLKPFDIQKAREGKPVCTRDGRKVRIICFDAKDNLPIIALITNARGDESLARYKSNGRFINLNESDCDLMMLPERKEGWAKIRKDINLYDTKEEADRKMIGNDEYVTAKVEWEE